MANTFLTSPNCQHFVMLTRVLTKGDYLIIQKKYEF